MAQTFLLSLTLTDELSLTDKKNTLKCGIKDLSWSPFYLFSFISYPSSTRVLKTLQITEHVPDSLYIQFLLLLDSYHASLTG